MVFAAGMTFLLETARTGFELLLSIGAGSGLLYLLRWYWWRINAWSEIAAMAVSFVRGDRFLRGRQNGQRVPAEHGVTRHRVRHHRRVDYRDADDASGKRGHARQLLSPDSSRRSGLERRLPPRPESGPSPDSISMQLLGWVLGCAFVYATLFGFGSALYGHTAQVIVWGFVWIVSGAGLLRVLSSLWRG